MVLTVKPIVFEVGGGGVEGRKWRIGGVKANMQLSTGTQCLVDCSLC